MTDQEKCREDTIKFVKDLCPNILPEVQKSVVDKLMRNFKFLFDREGNKIKHE